jgi:catechol 2,3-dioxygenase-like lactoylglutathione lyase family enzyme
MIRLDHVNLITADVPAMVRFYEDVVGLKAGDRPPFPFGGAWLYDDAAPAVHLVEVGQAPQTQSPRIEHFALVSQGLDAFIAHLDRSGVPYRLGVVPGSGLRQVNLSDPDGNHIHIDFPEG